jgi:sulfite reductase beta subunit-like hemoprotein
MDNGTSKCDGQSQQTPVFGTERTLGVYPQKQDGLFMHRIRVLGGRISWLQWRKAACFVRRYSQRSSFHITTRQDIELHDIAGTDIKKVQEELASVGLITKGACGDTIRNITVCTGCESDPTAGGVLPVAEFLHKTLMARAFDLPRKFKISFSGCSKACARCWLNDMGFIMQPNGTFTVVGAGSLGPRPALGIELYKGLAAKHVAPVSIAALELFEKTGDRENRHRARLRHVREKLGDEKFKAELNAMFERVKASQTWPDVALAEPNRDIKLLRRLQLPNGNISCEEALLLADAAQPAGAELRINLEHGLELYGTKTFSLPDNLASLENLPIITACPGLSSCSRALTDTWGIAGTIRKHIPSRSHPNLHINISGCPNGCAHSAVADIGLIGMRRNRDGQSAECFRILTGGHNGIDDCLAKGDDIVFAEDIPATIERMLSNQQED